MDTKINHYYESEHKYLHGGKYLKFENYVYVLNYAILLFDKPTRCFNTMDVLNKTKTYHLKKSYYNSTLHGEFCWQKFYNTKHFFKVDIKNIFY
jgi:hypothetical protein